jgi:iduronate 2-sulfatase
MGGCYKNFGFCALFESMAIRHARVEVKAPGPVASSPSKKSRPAAARVPDATEDHPARSGINRPGLVKNTIVVLWGDHGIRTKHTNYEQANRIPLLIAEPEDR